MDKNEFKIWFDLNKTNGNWFKMLKTHHPTLFKEIDEWIDGPPAEKAFLFLLGTKLRPLCSCGNETTFYGKKGYSKRCSIQCALKDTSDTRKMKRANHSEERREQIKEKFISTSKARYGENFGKIWYKPKSEASLKLHESHRKATMLLRYGVDNPSQVKDISLKRLKTYNARTKEQREASRNKNMATRIKSGSSLPNDHPTIMGTFKQYTSRVRYLTNKNVNLNPALLAGRSKLMHVDHEFSIFEGFKNQVPPQYIAHLANLKLLEARENSRKNYRSSITLEELYLRIRNYG